MRAGRGRTEFTVYGDRWKCDN